MERQLPVIFGPLPWPARGWGGDAGAVAACQCLRVPPGAAVCCLVDSRQAQGGRRRSLMPRHYYTSPASLCVGRWCFVPSVTDPVANSAWRRGIALCLADYMVWEEWYPSRLSSKSSRSAKKQQHQPHAFISHLWGMPDVWKIPEEKHHFR